MTDDVFSRAVAIVLQHEGGLVDDPADPGGLTNYGISLRSYPELGADGIRGLTADKARAIYFTDWWQRFHLEQLPDLVAIKMLDLAVNMGIGSATRCLQRALESEDIHVAIDGVLGPATFRAANLTGPTDLHAALQEQAAKHYADLVAANPKLAKFAAGWHARAMS